MFIFTAKLNRKKAVLWVVILGILLCGLIFIMAKNGVSTETAALSAVVKTNEQRISFLESLGWKVDAAPIEEQTVLIPKTFPAVYEEYNALQAEQGFDLTKYAGMEATRYTYKILNYPDTDSMVVADLLVYRGEIIGGDIQSVALDGFMRALEKKTA